MARFTPERSTQGSALEIMTALPVPSRRVVASMVETAATHLAAARPVVLSGPSGRPAYLLVAGQAASAETIAFMVRWTTGYLRVTLSDADRTRLQLPLLGHPVELTECCQYAVSVDAAEDVTTGISARDRARTIRLLAEPTTAPDELTRPGHVVPMRVAPGGLLHRQSVAEFAAELADIAGMRSVAVLSELVNDRGRLQVPEDAEQFAITHGLVTLSMSELLRYRATDIDGRQRVRQWARRARYGQRAATQMIGLLR